MNIILTHVYKFGKIIVDVVSKIQNNNIRREGNIMMKKNCFTLAVVLITLAIIGVVATLTLPALMTNTQEQQAKTGLKKGINTLTEAGQMNQAVAGFDYASFNSASTDDAESQSLYGLLSNRTNVDYQTTGTDSNEAKAVNNGASNYVVFFRDGSALAYAPSSTTVEAGKVADMQDDGLVYGIPALYDTNGAKGPNLLSNCRGTAALLNRSAGNDSTGDCSDKSQRVIKDQFGVRLRGGYAVPNGAAARWAFNN